MDNSDLYMGLSGGAGEAAAVTVLYFARLKEALGCGSERIVPPPGTGTVAALREHLRARGGVWDVELASSKPVRVAVNQNMASSDTPIKAGDEIAFFPPVTGG